jgi:enoyl-CoA hydratase
VPIVEGKAVAVTVENAGTPANTENGETGPDALLEQRGHTLIVTMNRPHRRNALSTEMM